MSAEFGTVSNLLDDSVKLKKRKLAGEDGQTPKRRKKQSQSNGDAAPASADSPTSVRKKRKAREDSQPLEAADIDAPTTAAAEAQLLDASIPLIGSEAPADVQTAISFEDDDETREDKLPPSDIPAPFHSTRLSLYLPLHAISLSSATSSLLSTHLAPLLLTYYPPAEGVVLAYSDPVLSAKPALSSNLPLIPPNDPTYTNPETLALTADDYGVSWVWLTVTLLVFQPDKGMEMEGYLNICSEGFVGLVSYNYFQTGVAKNRIPPSWKWTGPGGTQQSNRKKVGKKYKLKDSDSQEDRSTPMSIDENGPIAQGPTESPDDGLGVFTDASGNQVTSNNAIRFRVVDSEVVPVHGRDRSLQIDGTLLDKQDELKVLEEEWVKFDQIQHRSRPRTTGDRASGGGSDTLMSGGLGLGRENSSGSTTQTPGRKHRMAY